MWQNDDLKNHLDTSSVIRSNSTVYMEWNLNDPENIDKVGNYRYRPTSDGISRIPFDMYDPNDAAGEYTGATNSDISIAGEQVDNEPTVFTTVDQKMKDLFSLDDCFTANRPRSGINKLIKLDGKRYLLPNNYVDGRPRYYVANKNDTFKYWTSYRKVVPKNEPNAAARYPNTMPGEIEVGVSKPGGIKFIDDVCPFVVYKNKVYSNRITLKMQTHTASVEGPSYINKFGVDIGDPIFGYENQQTPLIWKVQALKNNIWTDIYNVTESSLKSDGTPIIGPDGHVELAYGLRVPKGYNYQGRLTNADFLPDNPFNYDCYLVANGTSVGFLYTYFGDWKIEPAIYDWHLIEDDVVPLPLDDLNEMETYTSGLGEKYRDVDEIQGLRLVVTSMNTVDSTFDLIELSPRLVADVTDMVESYSSQASVSSMSDTSLPVGYLIPGTGSIRILDTKSVFNDPDSIFYGLNNYNIKFIFKETIKIPGETDYIVPIRTMYSEGNSPNMDEPPNINFELRDGYWFLEKAKAPSLFLRDVSLSVAIATMLDYIGFSNYSFKRVDKKEFTIPYFYTNDEKSVAEILQDLARASQSAMFFDEDNNLIIMSKEYFMGEARSTDMTLSGNSNTPHIIDIASTEKKRYNDGKIDYNERYIQRSISSLKQANFINVDQTLVYKPVLLWEASGDEATRPGNEMGVMQTAFSLSACALNITLSDQIPSVKNGVVENNVIDLGESIYWLARYNGYFYANGEIIKFDAMEFSVYGRVTVKDQYGAVIDVKEELVKKAWITSAAEYQKYFADVPFNGRLFPTGRVRIYTEPTYGTDSNGKTIITGIRKHGRGQFQTPIVNHYAGLNDEWAKNKTIINQNSDYLFKNKELPAQYDQGVTSGTAKQLSNTFDINGIVKNFSRDVKYTESELSKRTTAQAGMVQASGLVITGFKDQAEPKKTVDNLCLVRKQLNAPCDYYSARVRIIGEIKSAIDVDQTATGESTYYVDTTVAGQVITGGSGGIAINVNPTTNTGYFLEIIALSNTTLNEATTDSNTDAYNVIFYKNVAPAYQGATAQSVPLRLIGKRSNIVVDNGEYIGLGRQAAEEVPSVYDIAIERKKIGKLTRFFIYLNDREIGYVDDDNPLPETNTYALFSRGMSKVLFENTYAIRNYNSSTDLIGYNTASAFGNDGINTRQSMKKFALSGVLQNTYLNSISPETSNAVELFYDEFGTIMRECAYFNVKFDKAYPALRSSIAPTFNNTQGYFISGYTSDAYSAQFLIFNATDKALSLDDTSGNYLRILGVAFTQANQRSLSLDDYYNEVGSQSDVYTSDMTLLTDPTFAQQQYNDVRIDRRKRGKEEFNLQTEYIQRQDDALTLMGWLSNQLTKSRMMVGLNVFPYPIVQLGDIVELDYTDSNGVDYARGKRFVVYNISYDRSVDNLDQKVYLAEII